MASNEPEKQDELDKQNDEQLDNQARESSLEDMPSSSTDGLRVDATAHNGLMELLGQTGGHRRTLSSSSKQLLESHAQQAKFNETKIKLSRSLDVASGLGQSLAEHAASNDIFYSADLPLKVIALELYSGVQSLESLVTGNSVSPYLQSVLTSVNTHIEKLQNRLQDTTSKVLITGDLNAGKSSLCNAFLRKHLLPTDQQPCTQVYCEVIDASRNEGKEEVHAVYSSVNSLSLYNRENYNIYEIHPISELPTLVDQPDKFSFLVVYTRDNRPSSGSLLANGVVDICLIDAPGLNVDRSLTENIFGRQNEIDLVIFVVKAENYFTQSSKEFVTHISNEKALVFIVATGIDKIKDRQKCKGRIMEQVKSLVPETHKGASDFVHFVNAEGNDPDEPDTPSNPEHGPDSPDFDRLEACLRDFILQKRSVSKFAPVKNYLKNIFKDFGELCEYNIQINSKQAHETSLKLKEMAPELDGLIQKSHTVSDHIERDIERLSNAVYTQSMEFLSKEIDTIGNEPPLEYPGLFHLWSYASETRRLLIDKVQESVFVCEENARQVTSTAVDAIKAIGTLNVGHKPAFAKVFQKSVMFSRKRDDLGRHIVASMSVGDFIDFSYLIGQPVPLLQASKSALLASPSSTIQTSLTLVSLAGGAQLLLSSPAIKAVMFGLSDLSRLKQLALPALAIGTVGVALFVVSELPRTVPRQVARRIALELDEIDYVRQNSDRIASECRKVLRYPAQDVRSAFQSEIEEQARERAKLEKDNEKSKLATEFFTKLTGNAKNELAKVEQIALEQQLQAQG